jgi:2-desacetyl-2-hydroxyethyl bacteriochlorophyllide A dehydrogenase
MNDREATGVEFVAPGEVRPRGFGVDEPEDGEVIVDASLSVVSSGTERLVYRGEAPTVEADAPGVGELEYPTRYGYSVVGEIEETGGDTDAQEGERVHVMHPHQGRFTVSADSVRPVPDGLTDEQAVHLPNTETAVSFAMDGRPVVGERVAVFGQGVVGLLTTAVLSSFPVEVVAFDPLAERRRRSENTGADRSHHPDELGSVRPEDGYDLVYEVSGSTTALDTAVGAAGYDGRVVVGSWYGTESASVELGVGFHGEDITVSDSQVTEIAPGLRGRWTKERRLEAAWDFVEEASGLITDRFGIKEAEAAYEAVDSGALCVVFEYE